MAATRAVFETYELLENIIVCLGPDNIVQVTRVSRAWQALIGQSVRIRAARSLSPFQLKSSRFVMIPRYTSRPKFDIHPTFKDRATGGQGSTEREFLISPFTQDTLKAEWNTYATIPPVNAIYLELDNSDFASRCCVYAKGGVRVGDLVDTVVKMTKL